MVSHERTGHPPRFATAILALAAGRTDRGYLLGDLAEEFHEVAVGEGRRAASRWYWSQAVRSSAPLIVARMTSEGMVRSLGAFLVGGTTAIASATLFGLALGRIVGFAEEPPLGVLATVVTLCALVSSTCAGWASTWISGGATRWALALVGVVVVAPDVVYTVWHRGGEALPHALVPPFLAVLAAGSGLVLGAKLCRGMHLVPQMSRRDP